VAEITSTEEDLKLRNYELTVIVSPEVTEERFEAILENINRFITSRGGVISDVQKWGKKRLAYPIKHFTEGNYVLTLLKMKPEYGKELESSMRISEEVLRYLLINTD